MKNLVYILTINYIRPVHFCNGKITIFQSRKSPLSYNGLNFITITQMAQKCHLFWKHIYIYCFLWTCFSRKRYRFHYFEEQNNLLISDERDQQNVFFFTFTFVIIKRSHFIQFILLTLLTKLEVITLHFDQR